MQQLEIAPLGDICTPSYAARRLGVDPRTVRRLIRTGRLKQALVRAADGERAPTLLYVAEVAEYAEARKIVRGGSTTVT